MRWLLVLWDIDFTLINAGGVGTRLYRVVFRDMFGTETCRSVPYWLCDVSKSSAVTVPSIIGAVV